MLKKHVYVVPIACTMVIAMLLASYKPIIGQRFLIFPSLLLTLLLTLLV